MIYNIEYNLDHGINSDANPKTYTVNSGLIVLADPSRPGYYFTGWTETDRIPSGSTGDKSFTAHWEKQIDLTLTSKGLTVTYNGKEQSVSGFTSSISNLTFGDLTAGAKGTKAGEYTADFSNQGALVIRDGLGNDVTNHYNVIYVTGKLKIEKAVLTATAGNRSMTYGNLGSLTPATASVVYSGFVNGETAATAGIGGSVSYTYLQGTTPVTVSTTLPAGFYTIRPVVSGLTAENYTFVSADGTLTVNLASGLRVTVTPYNGMYNGVAQTVGVSTNVPAGTSFLYSTSGGTNLSQYSSVKPTAKNVSESKIIYVAAVNANYVTAFGSARVTITPRTINLSSQSANKTYDGTPLTSTVVNQTGNGFVNGEGFVETPVASGSITNAGSTKNTIVVPALNADTTLAENYTIKTNEGTLTVKKAVLTVTAGDRSMTYGDTNTLAPAEAVTYAGFVNGETAGTVAISGSVSYGYSYGYLPVTVSNFLPVGSYTIRPNVSGLSAANYSFTPANGTLTVTKSNKLTVTADSYSAKYDGLPHFLLPQPSVWAGTTIYYSLTGGAYPGDYSIIAPYALNVADSKTVTIAAVNSNYETAYTTASLTILKRDIILTSDGASKPYDRMPLTKPGVAVSGDGFIYAQGFRSDPSATGTITDVGSTPNTINVPSVNSHTNLNNYNIVKNEGTLTITPSDALKVIATPYSGLYNGVEQTIGASANITEGTDLLYNITGGTDLSTYLPTKPTAKNVEDSKTIYVAAVNSNYVTSFSSADVTITQRSITLTSQSDSKDYDGLPLTNTGVTLGGDGFVLDEGFLAAPAANGTITDPGTVTNTIVGLELKQNTLPGNYDLQPTEGTLKVRPRVTYSANTTDPVIGIPAAAWVDYHGSATIADATGITRTGYVLTGWQDQSTGDNIALGAVISPVDRNYDLLAVWAFDVFDTTYVANAPAGEVTNMPAAILNTPFTSTVTLAAANPVRPGYNFMGWRTTDINGTTQTLAAGGTFAMPANDVTFAAVWQIIISPVLYSANGGTGATYTEGFYPTFGDVTVAGNTFTRTGYTFLGWGTGANSGVVYTPGDVFVMPAAAVTLYAQWEQQLYTVSYVVTGGTLTGLDGATPYATYANLPYNAPMPIPDDPAEDGYQFEGWTSVIPATVPVGGVTIYGTMVRTSNVLENITDAPVPLAAPAPTWSVFNLIMTIATALASGTMLVGLLNKNKDMEGVRSKKRAGIRFSTLAPAIGAILAFILTQNMQNQAVLFDKWSLLMGGIGAVQAVLTVLGIKVKPKA
ncbi:MAG: InlB B-repeat-containing protein [Christensenella sp.]|nr:InlB B-repeat-containing protein [Christensenella sp.]